MGTSSQVKSKRVLLKRVCSLFGKVTEHTDTYWQPLTRIVSDLVCMKSSGWGRMDYETLMAVAGYGSSFVYKPATLPLNDYAFCTPPVGSFRRVKDSTGASWDWRRYKTLEGAWKAMKRALDSGVPVRVPWMEDAILAGYQEANLKNDRKAFVMCEPFAKLGKWWTWMEFIDWYENSGHGWLGRLSKKKARMAPPRAAAVNVLKTFVELATCDPRGATPGFKDVRTGLAAIAAYAEDIAEGVEVGGGWRGCHCAYPQISGRPSAAQYLRKLGRSSVLGKEASRHVLAAAEGYKAATAAWQEWGLHLGHSAPKNAWNTKKRRLAGATAILNALKHETLAIDEIERALLTVDG